MESQEILNEYEAAMFAANEIGYAGMTAEQVIRELSQRAEAAEAKLAELEAGPKFIANIKRMSELAESQGLVEAVADDRIVDDGCDQKIGEAQTK